MPFRHWTAVLYNYGAPFLAKYFGDKIPLYTTLSHTWGPVGGEVTYEVISKGTAGRKAGYEKIEKAAS